MQNADDFNDLIADSVNGEKGQVGEYQFAGVRLAAWTAAARELRQGCYALVDGNGHTSPLPRQSCSSM